MMVPETASCYQPQPEAIPSAAVTQVEAAEVSPVTLGLELLERDSKISPAPKKPTPVATP